MHITQLRAILNNRSVVFSNNATGGGDSSTDVQPGASSVNPNNHLEPVIGGSDTFNIIITAGIALALVMLGILIYKQSK